MESASSEARIERFPFGFAVKLIGNRFGARFDKRLDRGHFGPALKAGSHRYGKLLASGCFFEFSKAFWRFLLNRSAKNQSQFVDLPMNPLRVENGFIKFSQARQVSLFE